MPDTGVSDALTKVAVAFSGHLLQPLDNGYEDARRVHNGLIDKRPFLIARCRNVADVVDAVNLARDHGLEVAVKGGGHNPAGRATVDGGLMIDLSLMRGIHVDPRARAARAQGGATWGDYNRETQVHGLASTGGVVSTTGVGGLTLGGGLGWLIGKHGLAIDNLRSVQLVTADGRVVTASTDENPDLFWGVRGGGGNFGIATSLEYTVHPVGPMITGGLVAHPFARAGEVLRFFRDTTTASLPDELTVFSALIHAPDGSGNKLAGIIACHCGTLADGESAVEPIKAFGPPVMDALGPMPYTAMNQMIDGGYPKGALNYWKSSFLSSLSDEAIDVLTSRYESVPSPMSGIIVEHFHGAATRVGAGDTAFPHRGEGYNLVFLTQWMDPADNDRCIKWTRDSYAAMKPFMAEGRYVNYLDADETGDPVADAYGPNYGRLRQLKKKIDPTNFFHLNQNIRPD
jgi:FAD/FMN-containing dehydrogenase